MTETSISDRRRPIDQSDFQPVGLDQSGCGGYGTLCQVFCSFYPSVSRRSRALFVFDTMVPTKRAWIALFSLLVSSLRFAAGFMDLRSSEARDAGLVDQFTAPCPSYDIDIGQEESWGLL
jgi:hypothetical protein